MIQKQKQIQFLNQIPDYILNDDYLNKSIENLPKHYNFEIHKSIHRIIEIQQKEGKLDILVSLQFPEGLMIYACMISDILTSFTECETYITGDVTYGACCIDDITAKQLGCDLIIHYGHSCLIPINETLVRTLYVFVEINIDIKHCYETFLLNFSDKTPIYYIMSTIQFNTFIHNLKAKLQQEGYQIQIPQEKPRSQGEVLGCTSPLLPVQEKNKVLFVCDGRFHMESAMIQNPQYEFFQYNPYTYQLTYEQYDHQLMLKIRYQSIKSIKNPRIGCVILGTLGRQGSTNILERITELFKKYNIELVTLLVSEINFEYLKLLDVDFFVQIACPRISIDWAVEFKKPLLNPYELYVLFGETDWKEIYPMDYYSNNGGPWTNYHHKIKLKYEK